MLVRLDHRLHQVRLVRKGTQEQKPATLLEGRPARLNSA